MTCPAGPVWMPLRGWNGPPMRLIELDRVLPDPWRQARAHDEHEQAERERRDQEQAAAAGKQPGSYPGVAAWPGDLYGSSGRYPS